MRATGTFRNSVEREAKAEKEERGTRAATRATKEEEKASKATTKEKEIRTGEKDQ